MTVAEPKPELPEFLRERTKLTVVPPVPVRQERKRYEGTAQFYQTLTLGALSVVTCALLYLILSGWQCTSGTKLAKAAQAIMGADYQVMVCSRER